MEIFPKIQSYHDLWRISFLVFKKKAPALLLVSLVQLIIFSLWQHSLIAMGFAITGIYPYLRLKIGFGGIADTSVHMIIYFAVIVLATAVIFILASFFWGMFISLLKDESKTLTDAYRESLHLLRPIFIVNLISLFIISGGFILLIIPGIIFVVWYIFASLIVVLENKNWKEALKESKKITAKLWKKVFLSLLLILAFDIAIAILIDFFPYLALLSYAVAVITNAFFACYLFCLYIWLKQERKEALNFIKIETPQASIVKKILMISALTAVIIPLLLIPVTYIFAKKEGFVETGKMRHETSLDDLMIISSIEEGDGSGELNRLIDFLNGNSDANDDMIISEESMQLLYSIAEKKELHLSRYKSEPRTFNELMTAEAVLIDPAGLFKLSRRIVADTDKLAAEGDSELARKNLEAVLILGRKIQEARSSIISVLTGLGIEGIGAEGLRDFYSKIGDEKKSNLFNEYNNETKILGEKWKKKVGAITGLSLIFFSLLNPYSHKGLMTAREILLHDEEDMWRYEALTTMGNFYSTSILPINFIRRQIAKDTLEKVSKNDQNDNIRAISKDILNNFNDAKKMKEFLKAE